MNFEQVLYKSSKQSLFRKCLLPEKKGSLKPARQWRWQCICFDNNRFFIEVRIKQNLILHKTSNMSVFIRFSQKMGNLEPAETIQRIASTQAIQISNQYFTYNLYTFVHFTYNLYTFVRMYNVLVYGSNVPEQKNVCITVSSKQYCRQAYALGRRT
jgi:hypothetical protein